MHENCKANIFHKHHNESLVSLMKQENNASEATFSTKFTFERLFPFMQLENMSSQSNIFYVSYAISLIRPGFLSSELELPFRLLVLYSIGGIICSRAGISSSRAGNSSSRANLSTYIKVI